MVRLAGDNGFERKRKEALSAGDPSAVAQSWHLSCLPIASSLEESRGPWKRPGPCMIVLFGHWLRPPRDQPGSGSKAEDDLCHLTSEGQLLSSQPGR